MINAERRNNHVGSLSHANAFLAQFPKVSGTLHRHLSILVRIFFSLMERENVYNLESIYTLKSRQPGWVFRWHSKPGRYAGRHASPISQ